MKTYVRWHGREKPHELEFVGETSDSLLVEIGARSFVDGPKTAPTPKELVAMSQAACSGMDVVSLLQKMKQPLDSLSISCDVEMGDEPPVVFDKCEMVFDARGIGLSPDRVAYAVRLSLTKMCGVSTMIERSGCTIKAKLFVNENEFAIYDDNKFLVQRLIEWKNERKKDCPSGIALVTGGSRGIGRALCLRLSELGYGVIPAARGEVSGSVGSHEFDCMTLDVTSAVSRNQFVDVLREAGISPRLIVHNAGILDRNGSDAIAVGSVELKRIFESNLFAVVDLNRELFPLISEGSTVLFVSSYMGLPYLNTYSDVSYRLSKCALTLFARQFGKQLSAEGRNIAVACLHPGSVRTQMNPGGAISPEESAERISLLLTPEMRAVVLERNGSFWLVSNSRNEIVPNREN